jgi:hypothetical protein
MSEIEEGALQQIRKGSPIQHNLKEIEESMDGQSYFLGEVPQHQLVDPQAFLPLNSDRLIGSVNAPDKLINDANRLIEEDIAHVQMFQRKISAYAEKIEKNKEIIVKNQGKIKQNSVDMIHDKKNRDYWWGRAEEVDLDYQNAASSNRYSDWAWLIKKYGLKNADGTSINANESAVDELCNGETNNLIALYRETGKNYDKMKKERETENNQLFRENSQHLSMNEKLQGYISTIRAKDIAPLEEGVLLMKELHTKLGSLNSEDCSVTYGEMRTWAETFLNDFLKSNSLVPQKMATAFRKLASIPLPADHS